MYNNKCSRYQIEVTRPKQPKWGFSSAGRAPALHAGGQEFESPNLHHKKDDDFCYCPFYFAVLGLDENLPAYTKMPESIAIPVFILHNN